MLTTTEKLKEKETTLAGAELEVNALNRWASVFGIRVIMNSRGGREAFG